MGENRNAVPESSEHTERGKEKIRQLVVVEGKYDAQRILEIYDCTVVTTDGFNIFTNKEKRDFIKLLGNRFGAVIVTDSDKAGLSIRNFCRQLVAPEMLINVFLPDIYGKEKRKPHPSKEGKLGLEGISAEVIKAAFEKQGVLADGKKWGGITKAKLYEMGLSGGPQSSLRRKQIQKKLSLPENMSANLFLETVNRLMDADEFERLVLHDGV